jgi:hypothetical protein
MSDEPKNAPAPGSRNIKTPGPMMLRKTSSGEHPIMQAVRQELAATRKGPLSELKALNKRIDRARIRIRTGPPEEHEIEKQVEEEEPIPDTEPEGGRVL